ncbi:MAG: FkbM family methyltransferase [Verrucomicrobiota bacterium]
MSAARGFRIFGLCWLRPWFSYVFSPVLNRLLPTRTVRFADFHVRRGECDLYTFMNLFEDYPVPLIERALDEVEMVADLGANVGAFSLLIDKIVRQKNKKIKIAAVEPNTANIQLLREQPFAGSLLIHHAAVGPVEGTARLVRGRNSVSDYVDFKGGTAGTPIPILSLDSLCPVPALVKMDIEGGEWGILKNSLPDNVRFLVLEWHSDPGQDRVLAPSEFIPGNWQKISRDLYGSSTWYFRR